MQFVPASLAGVFRVVFDPARDHRGYLSKPYEEKAFQAAGIDVTWRQIIFQFTEHHNTVKGLHIQSAPFLEAKLITPVVGEVLWISVDLRRDSPTFMKHEKFKMYPGGPAVFVPRGFAHGGLYISDNSMLMIAADNYHSEPHGVGIAWNDPEIGIEWPLIPGEPIVIKDQHRDNPPLAAVRDRLGL
ncbi:MAG: dTDP-4-dehydrorhamnose 3,5-epimerase family protein [Alphaproteobacteria bacterium]